MPHANTPPSNFKTAARSFRCRRASKPATCKPFRFISVVQSLRNSLAIPCESAKNPQGIYLVDSTRNSLAIRTQHSSISSNQSYRQPVPSRISQEFKHFQQPVLQDTGPLIPIPIPFPIPRDLFLYRFLQRDLFRSCFKHIIFILLQVGSFSSRRQATMPCQAIHPR